MNAIVEGRSEPAYGSTCRVKRMEPVFVCLSLSLSVCVSVCLCLVSVSLSIRFPPSLPPSFPSSKWWNALSPEATEECASSSTTALLTSSHFTILAPAPFHIHTQGLHTLSDSWLEKEVKRVSIVVCMVSRNRSGLSSASRAG